MDDKQKRSQLGVRQKSRSHEGQMGCEKVCVRGTAVWLSRDTPPPHTPPPARETHAGHYFPFIYSYSKES